MDIRQLEMFRAVADAGSFTRAAERLYVSQSAISRQILLLEGELGGPLLHRSTGGITLTAQGEVLLRTTNRILRDLRETVAEISETREMQRGQLSIAAGSTMCLYVLPRLLKAFHALHPRVELLLKTGTTENVLQLLRNHQIDLALLTMPLAGTDLTVTSVLREELVVVTEAGHPLTRASSVDPKSLSDYPLVLFEPGSTTRLLIDRFFAEQQIPINVAMETESVEIIKAMVASGLGVGLIPYIAIAGERRKRFGWTRVRGQRLYRDQAFVYLQADHNPRAINEMMRVFDELKADFGGKPPRRRGTG